MKLVAREANADEKLGIDPEATTIPDGVDVVDFGEVGCFAGLKAGDHVVQVEGQAGVDDGEYIVQVLPTEDSAFIREVE